MADTLAISLGKATANGKDAMTQCLFFKTLMRNAIGRDPDGAWLHMADDRQEMLVEYYPDVPGAFDWAKKAESAAELVWEQVAGRGKPNESIVKRLRV